MSRKEASSEGEKSTRLSEAVSKDDKVLECAVCLQSLVHPVQLQCRHIFCFLCVKGVAIQSKRCPMCRREIPPDYLDHPDLIQGSVKPVPEECAASSLEGDVDEACSLTNTQEPRWFYEGRNGWWEYDVRTAQDLETSFGQKEPTAEMLIAGFLYIIDFQNMIQYRRNEPNRRRRIKRDVLSNVQNWKGIAGLRPSSSSTLDSPTSDASSSNDGDVDGLSSGMSALNVAAADADASSSQDPDSGSPSN